MFTYICSLLIEKDGRVRQNISILLLCVFVCLSTVISSIFGKSFRFPFPYFVLPIYYFPDLYKFFNYPLNFRILMRCKLLQYSLCNAIFLKLFISTKSSINYKIMFSINQNISDFSSLILNYNKFCFLFSVNHAANILISWFWLLLATFGGPDQNISA